LLSEFPFHFGDLLVQLREVRPQALKHRDQTHGEIGVQGQHGRQALDDR